MRWPWRRDRNGTGEIRAKAEAKRRSTKKMTPVYERMADALAELPDDELALRLRHVLARRIQ